nr:UDP-glucose/GDP-mannose dehydrogenase family protein [Gemmatimonadaceae bacterium]
LPTAVERMRGEVSRGTVSVLVNPEFTREGSAIDDFQHPDRVVIGVIDDPNRHGEAALRQLYRDAGAPILVMSGIEAALAKLGSNLFLATKISFANEMASICEAFGAEVDGVVDAMAHDRRIGGAFLGAGVGFGGSCLPHQVGMTVRAAAAAGLSVPMMEAVHTINEDQRLRFVERLTEMLGSIHGRRVAILGLAFKPGTDDIRDAPSLTIARLLLDRGARVRAFDPMVRAREGAAALVPGLQVVGDLDAAVSDAEAVAVVTEWPEFVSIDWRAVRKVMSGCVVLDGRNCLDAEFVRAAGLRYAGFGRRERPEAGRQTIAWPVIPDPTAAARVERVSAPGEAMRQ